MELHVPNPQRQPLRKPEQPAFATVDHPGLGCLLAVDLMKLAHSFAEKHDEAASKALAHVLSCPHCTPRFNTLTSFYQLEAAPQAASDSVVAGVVLDSWIGQLIPARVLAAHMGGQVIAANLLPGSGCKLADHPLHAELHCESIRNGKIRCQLMAPAAGRGMSGTPKDILDRFAQQQYMVELSDDDDPYGACGFDTILQWDNGGKCLISPPHVLALSGHSTFHKLELTHLRAVPGYDMQ